MTAGLQGAGTEANPWLITTAAQLVSVLRDPASSGFYRVANAIDTGSYVQLSDISTAAANNYAPKVIDFDGYTARFQNSTGSTGVYFVGVHLRNARIHIRVTVTWGSTTQTLFYRSSATDCAIYASLLGSYSASHVLNTSDGATPYIVPREWKRVALFNESSPGSMAYYFMNCSFSGVTPTQSYVYTSDYPSGGMTRRTAPLTVASLDAVTANAFSDAGWYLDGAYMIPYQTESVALTLQTIAGGGAASRLLWLESERGLRYLGESDAGGAAQFAVRIRRGRGFAVLASEAVGTDDLRAGLSIAAGTWYYPPSDTGYVYRAGSAGRITSLSGVVFAGEPVVVDGITFTPRPEYPPAMSGRRSLSRQGAAQQITLDSSAGGGGPVIDGDPAYLEGRVEEIHPITGLRRALANCEVVAFERRGSDYVAMGNTWSDGIGGFRLETQVYGGGDVLAFAADFPGVIFQPGAALAIGDRVRPALANGYVYEIVQAGTGGGAEPVWWPDQGDGTEGDIGTARARARPYYQPVGHGPLKMIPM